MPVFNITDPVSVGLSTKADHYHRAFDNTLALYAGETGIVGAAAGDDLYFSAAGQLSPGARQLRQTFRGLTLRTHPDADVAAYKVRLDHADEIVMHDGSSVSSAAEIALGRSGWDDLTADITASGANGLDSGAEGASRWYEIHAIRKSSDGTKGLLLHRAKSYTIDQSQLTGSGEGDVNYSANEAKISQGFTPAISGYLPFIDVQLRKVGSPTGVFKYEIFADSGGSPTGAALAQSDKFDVTLLTSTARLVRLSFRSPASLTASTIYHLVLTSTSANSTSNYLRWDAATSNVYAGGVAKRWDGAAWQTSGSSGFNGVDMIFKTYVVENDTAVTMPSGYDQRCLVGYVYNTSGSDLRPFAQQDRTFNNLLNISGGESGAITTGTPTLLDLSVYLPPVPVRVSGLVANTTSGEYTLVGPVPDGFRTAANHGAGGQVFPATTGGGWTVAIPGINTQFQAIYMSVSAGTGYFYMTEWEW